MRTFPVRTRGTTTHRRPPRRQRSPRLHQPCGGPKCSRRAAARIRRASADAQDGQVARESVPATTPATGESDMGSDTPVAPGGAEIIDISGRIGDQVYDQYSDAANRAVGD